MEPLTLPECLSELRSWSKSLVAEVEQAVADVNKAMDPATPLPRNCPSHASLASMALSGVGSKLKEVEFALKQVREAIGKSGI